MHARAIEWIVAVDHPQEAGALFEGLRGLDTGTSFNAMRPRNGPLASRNATMFSASVPPIPETRASSGAEAVLTSTPTALTQSSTTASSERESFRLGYVMLILTDADGFRVNFD